LPTKELEKIILGGMIAQRTALEKGIVDLLEEDFSDEYSRSLFMLIKKLAKENDNKIDYGMVIVEANKNNVSSSYVSECDTFYNDKILLQDQLKDRIGDLQRVSDLRFAYVEAMSLLKDIKDQKITDQIFVAKRIKEIATDIENRHDLKNLEYYGDDAKQLINRRVAARRGAVLFGMKGVDDIIDGMQKGQLIIVAARPGVGKSALALIPIVSVARRGEPVKVMSIEMTKDEYGERLLAMMSGVPIGALVGKQPISQTESIDLVNAMIELSNLPISIDDASRTIDDVEKAFITAKGAKKPIRLMVIDHFGLMKSDRYRKSKSEELSEISNELKQVAKRHEATIILLSQLNREHDKFTRPAAGNLRETGSLEQDADKILFLWLDKDDPKLTHLAVDKNRQGVGYGEVELIFDGSRMRFSEQDDYTAENGISVDDV
jgi:replicative DNA helicase